ncbi:MAG: tRNA (guanosine(46)-N7)-methyltransferase TrmB [Bacteroidales bacterium]
MGKNKLKKFREMDTFPNVFQSPFGAAGSDEPFHLKGKWSRDFFKNDNPIILELGCGKGEYAVGLARRFPNCNYIGVDIKGARMWTGAKDAVVNGIPNVAFIRTNIEMINNFFSEGEVSEIWITFPDPQMKKVRKRLTSSWFLKMYRSLLKPEGIIHLKTDSPFLYTYTDELVRINSIPTIVNTADLYHSGLDSEILQIKTFYEQQWLDRGLSIKYISFVPADTSELIEPDIEIEEDTYRSFSRGYIQCPELMAEKGNEREEIDK